MHLLLMQTYWRYPYYPNNNCDSSNCHKFLTDIITQSEWVIIHWTILYYWRECFRKKMKPKTWRISGFGYVIFMKTSLLSSYE